MVVIMMSPLQSIYTIQLILASLGHRFREARQHPHGRGRLCLFVTLSSGPIKRTNFIMLITT